MKMKKGFTLIELLAVIVILAIIALIATPIILNIINDAKEEATIRSADNYLSAVEIAIGKQNLKEEFNPGICEIQTDGNLLCEGKSLKIDVDGTKPSQGWILINNGKIQQHSMFIDSNTVTKTEEKTEVVSGNNIIEIPNATPTEYYIKSATETTKTTGIVPAQDSSGNVVVGSEFKIKVNDTIGFLTFFVLSNDGEYVNLIAEQNITSTGEYTSELQDNDEWYSVASDSKYGPQTAYTYLSNATSSWTNIPIIKSFTYLNSENQSSLAYGYKSIITAFDQTTENYITTITPNDSTGGNPVIYENMRARLPEFGEISNNTTCTSTSGSCPLWLVNYLSTSQYYSTASGKVNSKGNNRGYWTMLSMCSGGDIFAKPIGPDGSNNYMLVVRDANIGVRPVITIPKSDILKAM